MSAWWTLQGVVLVLCGLSEWAVRRGGPRSNRSMRWLGALAIAVFVVPRPAQEVARLVPVQAAIERLQPVTVQISTALQAAEPVTQGVLGLAWLFSALVGGLLMWQLVQRIRLVRGAALWHGSGRVG